MKMAVVNLARAISALYVVILVNQQVISAVGEDNLHVNGGSRSSQADNSWSVMVCPGIGPNMFGDARYHSGCNLWASDSSSSSFSWPTSSSHQQEDKMKPALNKWLDQLSEQLLNSTRIVNNLDQKLDESEGGHFEQGNCCRARLQCCRVETRLAYPIYGTSLTTGKLVKIIQETEAGGIQQPVIYRHCLSEKTNLVRGRCHQSSLPRLFYVQRDSSSSSPSTSGYPFYQDLLVMPSNCDCLVQLQDEEAEVLDSDQDDGLLNTAPVNPEESRQGSGEAADDVFSSNVDY